MGVQVVASFPMVPHEPEKLKIVVEPGMVVTDADMQRLAQRGQYEIHLSYIGGHGDTTTAKPTTAYTGPRYQFDPATRKWYAC